VVVYNLAFDISMVQFKLASANVQIVVIPPLDDYDTVYDELYFFPQQLIHHNMQIIFYYPDTEEVAHTISATENYCH